jgi:hypothetical protein
MVGACGLAIMKRSVDAQSTKQPTAYDIAGVFLLKQFRDSPR